MRSELTDLARSLRKRSTDAENLLWRHSRSRRLEGFKFRRQQPIGGDIVDFVCFENRIIIEVDGGQRAEAKEEDSKRQMVRRTGLQGAKVLE